MIVASLGAFLLFAASIAPQPFIAVATHPGVAAAQPAGNQPLRRVSYKVSEGTRQYSGGEHYEGFSSSSSSTTDSGTVTVAIVAVQSDALGMNVTELMNSTGHESTFAGTVFPDGMVSFGPDTIQDVTREMLKYFGPQFIPQDNTLDVGSVWNVHFDRQGVEFSGQYKVMKVDGPLLTINETETEKIAAQNVTINSQGTVTLKPSLLVPMSGDIHRTIRHLTVSGTTNTDLSMHFERVSDSKDTAP